MLTQWGKHDLSATTSLASISQVLSIVYIRQALFLWSIRKGVSQQKKYCSSHLEQDKSRTTVMLQAAAARFNMWVSRLMPLRKHSGDNKQRFTLFLVQYSTFSTTLNPDSTFLFFINSLFSPSRMVVLEFISRPRYDQPQMPHICSPHETAAVRHTTWRETFNVPPFDTIKRKPRQHYPSCCAGIGPIQHAFNTRPALVFIACLVPFFPYFFFILRRGDEEK